MEKRIFFDWWGFFEIIDNSVKLLVESIERSNDIEQTAQRSLDRAKKRQVEKT
ncbi:hypothetical protein Ct9H90mP29_03930 [bacterium]|nr:MAG: hypothetical protein Ct9H90mP29_03930 [bacterium]